jgi:adenylate cyclase
MSRHRRRRILLFSCVGLFVTGLALIGYAVGAFGSLENQTVDTRFSIRGARKPPTDIVVVGVDANTFRTLNLRWPFPRALHAQLIDRLRRDGAAVIAFDIQISEPTDAADDNALAEAIIRAHGRTVLSTTEVTSQGTPNVFGGGDILRLLDARAGNTSFPTDRGGEIRRVPYSTAGLESFSLAVSEVLSGHRIAPSSLGGRTAWIDYYGPAGTIRSLSYAEVVRGNVGPAAFAGKVVVVGASAPSLQDVHATATGSGLMSGAEIQANAIETARQGFPLRSSPGWLNVLAIVVLGMAAPLAAATRSARAAAGVVVVLGASYTLATQLAFDAGRVIAFTYPLAALLASTVGTTAVQAITSAFERERVRNLFARFVPEQVVDEVIARSDGLRLGGVRLEGTILFSDLRGFTSYSESLPAEQVIEVLNRYLGEMSDAILDAGGTLTAYMGDGIMALFGGPIEHPDHADRALVAAKEMLRRLDTFNAWLRNNGYGDGFRMGIGINSGTVMAGNVGSERRLDYTAIGDTVNTASRLEGMTKGTPYQLFLSASTRQLLTRELDTLVEVGELEVRGRSGRIRVWSTPQATDAEATTAAERADAL